MRRLTVEDIEAHLTSMPADDVLEILGITFDEFLSLVRPYIIEQKEWLSEHFGDSRYDDY